MTDTIIRIDGLTKNYGGGRGIFQADLEVRGGECFGYVGTNGSGKTTTIRSIMGFIRPDKGTVQVKDMDAWLCSTEIKRHVSYVPGEIAFPPMKTGMDFLKKQAEFLGIKNLSNMNHLIKLFRLDPTASLARMSKGMKQKTVIVAALMGDREILIMDEPTTGLDPLMREVFVDLINNEKKRGKTIFISDHIFEEVEELCDRTAFVKNGKIIDIVDMEELRSDHKSVFHIGLNDGSDELEVVSEHNNPGKLFQILKEKNIKYIREKAYTLEDYFNEAYKRN